MADRIDPALRVFAEKVAAFRKERKLRMDPMLDDFAVRLNREPTWHEINDAMIWLRDFQECGATTVPCSEKP